MTKKIWTFLKKHKEIAVGAICAACMALSLAYGINTHKQNIRLTQELEMVQNNVEAYQATLNGSWWASYVFKMDMNKLAEQNDSLIQEIDKVRKELNIQSKHLNTAATQTQVINVTNSKPVDVDLIEVLKDTVYTDSLWYNPLTKVSYTIGTDTVSVRLDVENTQYLFIFSKREYKNKKNFFKRLITLDWKRVNRYRYEIVNTNDLINTKDVRVIEKID